MCRRVGSSASARPRLRMPVPASSASIEPSESVTCDAGGVAAVADRLRAGGGDRAAGSPELDPHRSVRPRRPLGVDRPEDRDRRRASRAAVRIGKAETSISCSGAVGGADRRSRECAGRPWRTAIDQRQLVVGDRLAGLVEGAEDRAPLARGRPCRSPRSACRAAPRRPRCRRQHPALVDEEGRRRERGHQVAGEDQLDRLLRHEGHLIPPSIPLSPMKHRLRWPLAV